MPIQCQVNDWYYLTNEQDKDELIRSHHGPVLHSPVTQYPCWGNLQSISSTLTKLLILEADTLNYMYCRTFSTSYS